MGQREIRTSTFQNCYRSGEELCVCSKAKHLGHFITDKMSADDDIFRQCYTLYAQANMQAIKCNLCSDHVKICL